MAVNPQRLVDSALLAATDTLIYTVPAGASLKNMAFAFVNNDASGTYGVTLYIVPSGETVAATYNLLREADYTLAPERTKLFIPGQTMNAGDMVYAKSGTADKVVLHLSGDLIQGS